MRRCRSRFLLRWRGRGGGGRGRLGQVLFSLSIIKIADARMEQEDNYESGRAGRRIRLRIVTNRNLQFMTTVKHDATISDLANRALSVYLELSGQGLMSTSKKQLTVSAVKQGVFYMPKSECVSNLLNPDDQVEVLIIKAKPKYPHQLFHPQLPAKKNRLPPSPYTLPPPRYSPENPLLPSVIEVPEGERHGELLADDHKTKSRLLDLSKRQKKKEKKEKWEKRYTDKSTNGVDKANDHKEDDKDKLRSTEPREILPESSQRKRIKVDHERSKSPDKSSQICIPSPKITFHLEPKLDSPRIPLLTEQKKKGETPVLKAEQIPQKWSEDQHQKRLGMDKLCSPIQIMKSPAAVPKTPVQVNILNQSQKLREKQELSNFSLSRKGSEDRRSQFRNRKNNEQNVGLGENRGEYKEVIISSIIDGSREGKQQGGEGEGGVKEGGEGSAGGLRGPGKAGEPVRSRSLVLVEPASESDSQENKTINILPIQSNRFKELIEIKSRIHSYMMDSESQS